MDRDTLPLAVKYLLCQGATLSLSRSNSRKYKGTPTVYHWQMDRQPQSVLNQLLRGFKGEKILVYINCLQSFYVGSCFKKMLECEVGLEVSST